MRKNEFYFSLTGYEVSAIYIRYSLHKPKSSGWKKLCPHVADKEKKAKESIRSGPVVSSVLIYWKNEMTDLQKELWMSTDNERWWKKKKEMYAAPKKEQIMLEQNGENERN